MTSALLRRTLALGLALALFACDKPKTEEVIFGAIHENVHALEKKDVETVMATIHPDSPVYAGTREAVEAMFKMVDWKYTVSDLRIEEATPEEVKVSYKMRMEVVGEGSQFVSNLVEGVHTLRLDKGRWKIYKTLATKVTDLKGKPLFATEPAPIPPAEQLPPGAAPAAPPAPPAPATPPAK